MFILHGSAPGYDWQGLRFYRAIADAVAGKRVRVLSLPFASGGWLNENDPMIDPKALAARDRSYVNAAEGLWRELSFTNPHKRFTVVSADLNPKVFRQQVRDWAEVLYAHGGDTPSLIAKLLALDPQFAEAARQKVCAGYSAGAACWATLYYSNDYHTVLPGLDVLPAKLICHYHSSKFPKLMRLVAAGMPDRPTVPIHDGEFIKVDPTQKNAFLEVERPYAGSNVGDIED